MEQLINFIGVFVTNLYIDLPFFFFFLNSLHLDIKL